tara:strand:+ start:2719 stop:2976 length:258 start_codon:yes stop_codon:yes gene_type:complete
MKIKIKPRTIQAFHKWAETHKMSDNFVWNGKVIKGSEFKKVLYGDAPKAEAKPAPLLEDPVNIDIEEKEHADMGQSFDAGDIEKY